MRGRAEPKTSRQDRVGRAISRRVDVWDHPLSQGNAFPPASSLPVAPPPDAAISGRNNALLKTTLLFGSAFQDHKVMNRQAVAPATSRRRRTKPRRPWLDPKWLRSLALVLSAMAAIIAALAGLVAALVPVFK